MSPQEWSSDNGILPVRRGGGFVEEGITSDTVLGIMFGLAVWIGVLLRQLCIKVFGRHCLIVYLMENVKEMAISSSLSTKAKIDSLLRGIDSITSGFEADISKGEPTCLKCNNMIARPTNLDWMCMRLVDWNCPQWACVETGALKFQHSGGFWPL
ncbi:hypothetical protein CK203_095091 [Vitis vinifera]|uniref:Uncharacterized protein n=1 Tax=Vitis vinifera TaxID=29760 RepID=A0A438EWQ9_VITVI|nr:hypothetical protein CK203_095091 [Vitis vinifera]